MPVSIQWHPVAPASAVRAGDKVLAAMAAGQALALWRSAAGQLQAWEDRCPHRGVALSLGRVRGDRLACAYHGWEYAAGSGRCVAIPALPELPVPGRVCVRTFTAQERQGMVWVRIGDGLPGADGLPADDALPVQFLRTMGLNAAPGAVENTLAARGFRQSASCQWHGDLAGQPMRLFTLFASGQLCLLHLACATAPAPGTIGSRALPAAHGPAVRSTQVIAAAAVFAAARMLRRAIEAAAA